MLFQSAKVLTWTMTLMSSKVYRLHVVTDQGNGGAYCSKCDADLSPSGPFGIGPAPYPCPGCGAEWIDTEIGGYNFGGSDF